MDDERAWADNNFIDPKATALLSMDFQVSNVEGLAWNEDVLLDRMTRLLGAARNARVMVIYVVVGFRPGHPELSNSNMSFLAARRRRAFNPDLSGSICDAAGAIHSAVAPKDSDVIVTKHRTSAFAGTELDLILRANGIHTLLLAGITTGGVVLSTLSHAADADYRVVVVEDCCSDHDLESHRILVRNVFPCRAAVVSSRDLVSEL